MFAHLLLFFTLLCFLLHSLLLLVQLTSSAPRTTSPSSWSPSPTSSWHKFADQIKIFIHTSLSMDQFFCFV